MQPFDSPLHRFNQREVMIRQTRGSHQSRKTTTTADVATVLKRIPFVAFRTYGTIAAEFRICRSQMISTSRGPINPRGSPSSAILAWKRSNFGNASPKTSASTGDPLQLIRHSHLPHHVHRETINMENGAAHYDAILHAVTLVCSKTTSVERPCHLKKLAEQLLLIKLVSSAVSSTLFLRYTVT